VGHTRSVPLPIDTARAIRTRADMHALVEAVRDAAGSESETDALEWKRELDLTTKAGLATIAKAVLGFSNRDAAMAARVFEGCAYFLAGVSPKRLDGVSYVDGAKVEAGVRVYTGAEPQWRALTTSSLTERQCWWSASKHPVRAITSAQ